MPYLNFIGTMYFLKGILIRFSYQKRDEKKTFCIYKNLENINRV